MPISVPRMKYLDLGIKKPLKNRGLLNACGGPDGTRTRDLRRDRPAF